ncbi:DUF2934 domain-containing protein [Devosia sp.]|uniref:DUF2934 domain-containing protein n=1 Tax=Devosia sp. TaxID=1871048 RepID=UPI001B24DCE4|nr:DUF2934 domain-containing protein [Devosia sp.]MBO9589774.1 DUF2934 domain-containing protein [Devosia sp.]
MPHVEEYKIRDRAYQLWEEAGQPEDREQEFWFQAERELAEEDEIDVSREASVIDLPPLVSGNITH